MLDYIESRRGAIEVTCREGLESLVCDCYWIGQERLKPDFTQVEKVFMYGGS